MFPIYFSKTQFIGTTGLCFKQFCTTLYFLKAFTISISRVLIKSLSILMGEILLIFHFIFSHTSTEFFLSFPKDCSFGSRISKYSRLPSTGLSEASTGVWSFFLIQINTATLMTFSTKRALKLKRIKGTKLHSNSSSTTNLRA